VTHDHKNSGIKRPQRTSVPAFGHEGTWQEREKIAFRERQLSDAMRQKFKDHKKKQEAERKTQEERLKLAREQVDKERKKRVPALKYEPFGMWHGKSPLFNLLKTRELNEQKKLEALKAEQIAKRLEKLKECEQYDGLKPVAASLPSEKKKDAALHSTFDRASNGDGTADKAGRDYRSVFKNRHDKITKSPGKDKGDGMDR